MVKVCVGFMHSFGGLLSKQNMRSFMADNLLG